MEPELVPNEIGPEVLPPPPTDNVLTLAELLADREVVLAKEAADKALIESIAAQTTQGLKPKLLEWVMRGCPNAYPILSLFIQVPEKCSDGEVRSLHDYIVFCSGSPISDHVAALQRWFPDIALSFSYDGVNISIVVSKITQ